jgi:hypothetical protein
MEGKKSKVIVPSVSFHRRRRNDVYGRRPWQCPGRTKMKKRERMPSLLTSKRSLGSTCCMRKVLFEQADFHNEKPLLQVVIETAGHNYYFLPKFHCEFNLIEIYSQNIVGLLSQSV